MNGHYAALALIVLAGGCSSEDGGSASGETQVEDYAANIGTSASAKASAAAGGARSVAESNDVWDFAYSYPAAAGNTPGLRELLDQRLEKAKNDLQNEAIDGRAEADKEGFPFNPYSLKTEWKVVANLPDWLSLSSETYIYEGGAHGNTGFDALLWDKRADKSLEPNSLFQSIDALESAVHDRFCASLDKQREKRRNEPVDHSAGDWMNTCPKISDTTIIVGSSNNRTFDRVGFLIGPYVAGPYVEGTYEVTVPVNKAVKAAVKPEYASSFTVTG